MLDVAAVVHGQENVCGVFERGEGGFEAQRVVRLEEHECHAGAEEHDAGFGVCIQFFVFEVFFPKGYGL